MSHKIPQIRHLLHTFNFLQVQALSKYLDCATLLNFRARECPKFNIALNFSKCVELINPLLRNVVK